MTLPSTAPPVLPAPAPLRARLTGLAGLLQAACAWPLDAHVLAKAGALEHVAGLDPGRAAAGVLALCALACLVTWRAVPAWLVAGALTLLLSTPYGPANLHALQALLLAAGLLACARALARPRPGLARLLLVLLPLPVTEALFATVARSHAVGYTLAARLWFARHWSPPSNSLGFRDVEHPADGAHDVFVLGDSFVSGVGIADVAQRFGERLAAELGPPWQVHNLGLNGTATAEQRAVLERQPFTPEAIVLSYYVNDIAGAGQGAGEPPPRYRPYRDLGRVAWLVSRSYLLDYLYWLAPRGDLAAEAASLARWHATPAIVAAHERELEELVAAARARTPRVVAVLFPELPAPEASQAALEPARRVFARLGVPCVEVTRLLDGLAGPERVINPNDAHPSAAVHARVGAALAEELRRLGPP